MSTAINLTSDEYLNILPSPNIKKMVPQKLTKFFSITKVASNKRRLDCDEEPVSKKKSCPASLDTITPDPSHQVAFEDRVHVKSCQQWKDSIKESLHFRVSKTIPLRGHNACYVCAIPFNSSHTKVYNDKCWLINHPCEAYGTTVKVCSLDCSAILMELAQEYPSTGRCCSVCRLSIADPFYKKDILEYKGAFYCDYNCRTIGHLELSPPKLKSVEEECQVPHDDDELLQ